MVPLLWPKHTRSGFTKHIHNLKQELIFANCAHSTEFAKFAHFANPSYPAHFIHFGYFAYFGVTTSKFNGIIKDQIRNQNNDLDVDLKKVKLHLDLKNISPRILADMDKNFSNRIKYELFESMIEINTDVCSTVEESAKKS